MAGGGGANAALPSNPVPVAPAATKAPATLKPKNTAPAAKSSDKCDGYS
jgi:hypothetical protein